MLHSTLCYLEREGQVLMLFRDKKKNDGNRGKWIGVGGKLKESESPDECLLREVKEETGLTLTSYALRGIVTFVSDLWETEQMYLFTADGFTGTLTECEEGTLAWKKKEELPDLPMWEGDRLFLDLLREGAPFFLMKLVYRGDRLVEARLNGKEINR